MRPIKSAPPAWQMRSKGEQFKKQPDNYSTNRRAAKVIEATQDGHAVMIECPYCYQLHIHAAPTECDPLRLRKAPCDPSRTYIIDEVAK